MAASADVGANTMCHGPVSGIMQLVGNLPQACTRTDRRFPRRIVHTELLEIDHVDSNSAILASETCIVGSLLDHGWFSWT